jgi:hypothetical protein
MSRDYRIHILDGGYGFLKSLRVRQAAAAVHCVNQRLAFRCERIS